MQFKLGMSGGVLVGLFCLTTVVYGQQGVPYEEYQMMNVVESPQATLQKRVAEPAPAWMVNQEVDRSAFRYVVGVPAVDVPVPTVVEVPVQGVVANRTVVVEDQNGVFGYATYVTNIENTQAQVQVLGNGTRPALIADGRIETQSDFPLEGFTEGGNNDVALTFSFDRPITTSELRITPAANVTLPQTITIQSVGSENANSVRTVLARDRLRGTTVRFPEVTADTFLVTFTLAQPLRLAEMSFVQKGDYMRTDAIRFLAQPGSSYRVYIDPDRSYGQLSGSRPNLTSDDGVRVLSTSTLQANSAYRESDADGDGFADLYDNCPSVANSDQRDVDSNGRGDACDDFDRDGVMTVKDNCPTVPNRDQRDTDRDGVGDACDTEEDRFTEANPWVPWVGMGVAVLVLAGLMVLSVRGVKKREEEGEVVKETVTPDAPQSADE